MNALLDLIVCTECKTRVEYHEDRDGYMSCECWIRGHQDEPTPEYWIEINDRYVNECAGCGKHIPERSIYRCSDCCRAFHHMCLDHHCKHGDQKQELRSENLFLKQQVNNLEEYVTKGVAFRDELQSRIKELECQKKALQQVNEELEKDLQAEKDVAQAAFNTTQEISIKNKSLEEAVTKAACGPRLDASKCSGCNGTGIGNCICGGKGTVEGERDGYKVAALERISRAAPGGENDDRIDIQRASQRRREEG